MYSPSAVLTLRRQSKPLPRSKGPDKGSSGLTSPSGN
jgi:hypothetical protein